MSVHDSIQRAKRRASVGPVFLTDAEVAGLHAHADELNGTIDRLIEYASAPSLLVRDASGQITATRKDFTGAFPSAAGSSDAEREIAEELRRLVADGWSLERVLHTLGISASESARILAEARA